MTYQNFMERKSENQSIKCELRNGVYFMEKLQKVVLSIGMNDKDKHKQIIGDLEVHDIIMQSVASCGIIGGTLKSGNVGMYNGEIEKSCELVLYDVERENVITLCDVLKMALNQESIAVEIVKNVDIMFI